MCLVLGNVLYFYLSFSDWQYLCTAEDTRKRIFKTDAVSLFCISWMFNFSVIFIKKLFENTSQYYWILSFSNVRN